MEPAVGGRKLGNFLEFVAREKLNGYFLDLEDHSLVL